MSWEPMGSAPKDGTRIVLFFPPQKIVIRSNSEEKKTSFKLSYQVVGRWWTAAEVAAKVGKDKAAIGARSALLRKHGGYWGPCRRSQPLTGQPSIWRHMTPEEDLHPESVTAATQQPGGAVPPPG